MTMNNNQPQWALVCNYLMVGTLVVAALFYFMSLGIVEVFLGLVCAGLAVAVFKRQSFGYFALAAFSFGVFWLAKTGQPFAGPKGPVMGIGITLMVLALVIHEQLAKRPASDLPDDLADEDSQP